MSFLILSCFYYFILAFQTFFVSFFNRGKSGWQKNVFLTGGGGVRSLGILLINGISGVPPCSQKERNKGETWQSQDFGQKGEKQGGKVEGENPAKYH